LSSFLDTNVMIRHLTGDPPAQARRATALLAAADELLVPDLVVAEVVFVLESFYEVKRQRVAELVRAVIGFPAIVVSMPRCYSARSRSMKSTELTSPRLTWSQAPR